MEKSYNPQEIAESVRQCGEMGCDTCQVTDDRSECVKMQLKAAADTIENLAEENRRLRDATEGYVAELARQMADMARECNTARERGLPKASGDYVLALNQIQAKLVALGRGSVIAAEPMDGGWRVTGITVEGRTVFSGECRVLNAELKDHSALSTQNSALVTADG